MTPPPTTTTVAAVIEPAAAIKTPRAVKIALLTQAIASLKTALVDYETELARLLALPYDAQKRSS